MGNFAKFVLGGVALFFVLGGPRLFQKNDSAPDKLSKQKEVSAPAKGTADTTPTSSTAVKESSSKAVSNRISSTDWLTSNGRLTREMKEAKITYYLLANSNRCHPDSLSPCLQEKIAAKNIDHNIFQYTYFLDRVMLTGSGMLHWDGKIYRLSYDRIRAAGWTKGEYSTDNNYTCRNFKFEDKNGISFIEKFISNSSVMVPQDQDPTPNGVTYSGQEARDWISVSINIKDFPLSVPDQKRRDNLRKTFAPHGIIGPYARSFLVITTQNGERYLTEAMDTGSGVKEGWIDWRISNTSADINQFLSLGATVSIQCFTFDDPEITIDEVLAKSQVVAKK